MEASDYFKTMFTSGFIEAYQKEVPLEKDDPLAVVAMLEHFYNIDYLKPDALLPDIKFHIEVCKVAKKYMLPELKEKAIKKFKKQQAQIEASCATDNDAQGALNLIKIYTAHEDLLPDAASQKQRLARLHYPDLMKKRSFRKAFV